MKQCFSEHSQMTSQASLERRHHSQCRSDDENEKRYSQRRCVADAFARQVAAECGCRPFGSSSAGPEDLCRPTADLTCVEKLRSNGSAVWDPTGCPSACEERSYPSQLLFTSLPTEELAQAGRANIERRANQKEQTQDLSTPFLAPRSFSPTAEGDRYDGWEERTWAWLLTSLPWTGQYYITGAYDEFFSKKLYAALYQHGPMLDLDLDAKNLSLAQLSKVESAGCLVHQLEVPSPAWPFSGRPKALSQARYLSRVRVDTYRGRPPGSDGAPATEPDLPFKDGTIQDSAELFYQSLLSSNRTGANGSLSVEKLLKPAEELFRCLRESPRACYSPWGLPGPVGYCGCSTPHPCLAQCRDELEVCCWLDVSRVIWVRCSLGLAAAAETAVQSSIASRLPHALQALNRRRSPLGGGLQELRSAGRSRLVRADSSW